MHNHSEKIEPKKLIILIIVTILFFGYAYMIRSKGPDSSKEDATATSTSINNE
ncbi:MAG: hypothetical protein ABL917_00700 [Parcubacteria group bacterium]